MVKELGPNVRAATPEAAVKFGEVVLLAVPWTRLENLPAAELFDGKIVIDAMNPYSQIGVIDFSPSTSSEQVARRLPGARLVKAFNTMYFETLRTGGKKSSEGRLVLFVAGDDPQAKAVVSKLIEEIGFKPVDTGDLHDGGRKQQPGSPIYNQPMTAERAQELLATLT